MRKSIVLGMLSLVIMLFIFCIASVNVAAAPNKASIKIEYSGSWSGSIGGDTSKSVDGSGSMTYEVEGDIIVATIQKGDDSVDPLTVSIFVNGEKKETETTTAGYGVVTVSYSFPVEDWEESEGGTCSTVFFSIFIFVAVGGVVITKWKKM